MLESRLRALSYSLTLSGLIPVLARAETSAPPEKILHDPPNSTAKELVQNTIQTRTHLLSEISALKKSGISNINFMELGQPKIKDYIDLLNSAEDVTLEELKTASSLAIAELNITSYSNDLPRENVVPFINNNALALEQALIRKNKWYLARHPGMEEDCTANLNYLRGDLYWSTNHMPADKYGGYGEIIWQRAAEIINEEFLADKNSIKTHELLQILTSGYISGRVSLRVIDLNSNLIEERIYSTLDEVLTEKLQDGPRAIDNLLSLRMIIDQAVDKKGDSDANLKECVEGRFLDSLDGSLSLVFPSIVGRILVYNDDERFENYEGNNPASRVHRITWLQNEINEVAKDRTKLSKILDDTALLFKDKNFTGYQRHLYGVLNYINLNDVSEELVAAWIRHRLTEEKDADSVQRGIGESIGSLYFNLFVSGLQVTEAGQLAEKNEKTFGKLEDIIHQGSDYAVPRSRADLGPMHQLFADMIAVAARSQGIERFFPVLKIETEADLDKIDLLKRNAVVSTCAAMSVMRQKLYIDEVDECENKAPIFQDPGSFIPHEIDYSLINPREIEAKSSLSESADLVISKVSNFEGEIHNWSTFEESIVAVLQADFSKYSNLAESKLYSESQLKKLSRHFPHIKSGNMYAPFSSQYLANRSYLFSKVFGKFADQVPESETTQKFDGISFRMAHNRQHASACRIAARLFAAEPGLRPIAEHRAYTGNREMKDETINILVQMNLLTDRIIQDKLSSVSSNKNFYQHANALADELDTEFEQLADEYRALLPKE